MKDFILWQRAEGAIILLLGLTAYAGLTPAFPLWAAVLWFFAPDISFAAYLLGNRVGAFVYNITHLYAFGPLVAVSGLALGNGVLVALGTLWLAHAGFDRTLGYGLKSHKSFKETHLGMIGRN